uniref:Uncharacterized protein n=1 Tax=Callorhinchus milii TaxID=7868 RepID=A0A4W3IAZ4_CALMI
MYQNLPPAERDKYWDQSSPQPPYTVATASETQKPSFLGSTFDMHMIESQALNEVEEPSQMDPKLHTPLLNTSAVTPPPAVSLKHFRHIPAINLLPNFTDCVSSDLTPDVVTPTNEGTLD